jgi:hypothetical protein
MKSKSSRHPMKRGHRDAFHEDIHMLELKEAAERRAQKNAIRFKELELQEKRQAAKVRKMEMDAEIQKAHLNMLNNMANMFASGSMGIVSGIRAANQGGSGASTQLSESTTTENWVHTQQQASTSSGGSSQSNLTSGFSGLLPVTQRSLDRLHDPAFNFPTNSFHFSGNDEL